MKTKMELLVVASVMLVELLSPPAGAQSVPSEPTHFPLPASAPLAGVQPTGATPVGVRPGGVALGSQPPSVDNTPVILPPAPVIPAQAVEPPPAVAAPAGNDLPATMTATAPVITTTTGIAVTNSVTDGMGGAPVSGAAMVPRTNIISSYTGLPVANANNHP